MQTAYVSEKSRSEAVLHGGDRDLTKNTETDVAKQLTDGSQTNPQTSATEVDLGQMATNLVALKPQAKAANPRLSGKIFGAAETTPLSAVGEALFVPEPTFLSAQPTPEGAVNNAVLPSEQKTGTLGQQGLIMSGNQNTTVQTIQSELDETGGADTKSLDKLSNFALHQIETAKQQSQGDPRKFALAIAQARREQIESAKGVKS